MRWLVLIHRYLGIAIGLLMAAWCLSGVVMMYVSYPELSEPDRLRTLIPIDLRGCCAALDHDLADDERLDGFQMEMLAGRPVVRLRLSDGSRKLLNLRDGTAIQRVSPALASQVARSFGETSEHEVVATLAATLDYDQWTLAGVPSWERPLYRFTLNDSHGTVVYVSSVSGKLVKTTTATERFWNWLGAVPHWLYFAQLRHNAPLWSRIVIGTSLIGCFLTITGLYLGVQRFLRRPQRRWSPYRGLQLWHHIPGLLFGVFTLSWVASGLISMNPWGFLESVDVGERTQSFSGSLLKNAITALSTVEVSARVPVSIDSAPLDGKLFLVASNRDGGRVRLDAKAAAAPLLATEVSLLVQTLNISGFTAQTELLTREDRYYFSHHRVTATLPAYRAIFNDLQKTRFYIDSTSGTVLARLDGNSRWYRWLHEGLHRMDFTLALRTRPVWDVVMLLLMAGVTTVCCTGAILGIRRLAS